MKMQRTETRAEETKKIMKLRGLLTAIGCNEDRADQIIEGKYRYKEIQIERMRERQKVNFSCDRERMIMDTYFDPVLPELKDINLMYAWKCIGAADRHENTDYDKLLEANYGKGTYFENRSNMRRLTPEEVTMREDMAA